MRTEYENFKTELSRSFPKTPDSFKRIVSETVHDNMKTAKDKTRVIHSSIHKRKRKLYKALLPTAACILIAGSTVAAVRLPVFQKWLNGMGDNAKKVEQSIVHSEETEEMIIMQPLARTDTEQKTDTELKVKTGLETADNEASPIYTVTDVYYDGSTLMFWVNSSSGFFELGDHVYINGIDSRLEYVVENEAGSGIYECKVSVLNEELQKMETDVITVKAQVYTSPDTKSDYSFEIKSDKFSASKQNSGNVSDLAFGELVSYDVTVSPSVINLNLEWKVREDGMLETLQWGDYILEDVSGKRLTYDKWLRSNATSVPEYHDDGAYVLFSQDLEIIGFDAASPTMTLIPVRVSWNDDGSMIEGSEEILEDYAVMIDLTK
ncbi:MAG: hypothetical protein NC433_16715 [Clostridiales bacterium]|nr:hypothetical protein [Clostridiales bacterium]